MASSFGQMFSSMWGRSNIKNPKEIDVIEQKESAKLYDGSKVVMVDDVEGSSLIVTGGINNASSFTSVASDAQITKNLVEEYRSMALQPEIVKAVDIIVGEIITCDEEDDPVTVDLDKVQFSQSIKDLIVEEFKNILHLLDFNETGFDKVKRWYVDGRQSFHIVVDEKAPRRGIQKLIQIDSRAIRPVTFVTKAVRDGIDVIVKSERKFYYNPNLTVASNSPQRSSAARITSQQEIIFDDNSIVYVDSGEDPLLTGIIPGYLNPAIRPLNNLVTIEDASVIYAITRAPEKRAFYLDVGTLQKKSAEEYMRSMMDMFKTKMVYDRNTGKVVTNRNLMGITEDYWLPRREGANATEISTVGGDGNFLSQVSETLQYFLGKVYEALKIPKSRLTDEGSINIGGSDLGEITRQELHFNRMKTRCRRRYSLIFKKLLKTQLILKNIITEQDWHEKIDRDIRFVFTSDNFIVEQQQNEITAGRFQTLSIIEPYVGRLFSMEFAMKDILRMTDQEIEEQRKKIEEEKKSGIYPQARDEQDDANPMKYRPDFIPKQNDEFEE